MNGQNSNKKNAKNSTVLNQVLNQEVNQQKIQKISGDNMFNLIKESHNGLVINLTKTIQAIKNPYALAVYSYLSSLPSDWNINPAQIQNHLLLSKNKTYKALTFLIEMGLIERIITRKNNRNEKFTYYLKLEPNEKFKNKSSKSCLLPSGGKVENGKVENLEQNQDKSIKSCLLSSHEEVENRDITNNKELLLRNNPFFNDPNPEPVQNLNTSSEVKKKNFYTPFFESFWEMTNKRGKKLQAFNAWKRNGCETRNMLELYQTHYIVKFGDCETKYQKHISTWIESKPWEEPTPLTEEEVIAKALEQKQMTKDNAPKKTSFNLGKPKNENKDTTSVFAHIVLALGLFVPENVLEAFLDALKSKNMPCSEYALQIYAKEMEKIKMGKLDVVECINKFIASGWKSFDVKYFVKKEVDKSSPATGNKEHSNDTSWIYQINLQTEQ